MQNPYLVLDAFKLKINELVAREITLNHRGLCIENIDLILISPLLRFSQTALKDVDQF